MKRILTVVGTRPNFIKVTQFRKVAQHFPQLELKIVHTGQHYDGKMADVFFQQFGLQPDFFLDVPPGSPNMQMAEIMLRLEKLIESYQPDLIAVVGDVNSTLAAALTANKLNIKLAHIESGLRSNDRTMPEEFNRILTDELADFLFVTEPSGIEHLRKEGKAAEKLFFVGNTMIDTLAAYAAEIDASPILQTWNLQPQQFVLMTMHRPATVDSKEGLLKLLELIREVCKTTDLIFPVHPRTVKHLQQFGLENDFHRIARLRLCDPLDYFAFQCLVKNAQYILTDSGGIQEESTWLGVPCLTLRPNTERPVTVTHGTNELLPFDLGIIRNHIQIIQQGQFKKGVQPIMWDGKATNRIFEIFSRIL